MKKLITLITILMSTMAFSTETKKIVVLAKDHLTSIDTQLTFKIGKEMSVDCNGPYMFATNKVTGYDYVQEMSKIKVDYALQKHSKYCPGDKPVRRMVYAPITSSTFSNMDQKIELEVPVDVDVFVKVTEVKTVKFEKVE